MYNSEYMETDKSEDEEESGEDEVNEQWDNSS